MTITHQFQSGNWFDKSQLLAVKIVVYSLPSKGNEEEQERRALMKRAAVAAIATSVLAAAAATAYAETANAEPATGGGVITMEAKGILWCLTGSDKPGKLQVTVARCSNPHGIGGAAGGTGQHWSLTVNDGNLYIDWLTKPQLCLGAKPGMTAALLVQCDASDISTAFLRYESLGKNRQNRIMLPNETPLSVVFPSEVSGKVNPVAVRWSKEEMTEPGNYGDVWTIPPIFRSIGS
jgi:hypothetical protein